MNLLQMSLSGACMILAVLAIRAFAVNRLPKKTFLVLWGIILLRLVLPFSLPSPLSSALQVPEITVGAPAALLLPLPAAPQAQTAAPPAVAVRDPSDPGPTGKGKLIDIRPISDDSN